LGGIDKNSIGDVRLQSAPIESTWIIAGAPRARSAVLSRSSDKSAVTMVWDCTAGEFDWTYQDDETVHILEGEAIIDDGTGPRSILPGDVVLFRAGSTCRWRVPVYVRKVAFLRVPMPRLVIRVIRALRKLKRLGRPPAPGLGAQPAFYLLASCLLWKFGDLLADPALLMQ
jgi:uncharacterized cupin superfamily protein